MAKVAELDSRTAASSGATVGVGMSLAIDPTVESALPDSTDFEAFTSAPSGN